MSEMKEMKFDVSEVRRELVVKGRVVTVRRWKMKDGYVYVRGVGVCKRRLIGEVGEKRDLERVVRFSGFSSVDEWWKWIVRFCGDERKYVYAVKVVEGHQLPSRPLNSLGGDTQ